MKIKFFCEINFFEVKLMTGLEKFENWKGRPFFV